MEGFQGFGGTIIRVRKRLKTMFPTRSSEGKRKLRMRRRLIAMGVNIRSKGSRKYGMFGFKDKKSYDYYTKEGGVYAR